MVKMVLGSSDTQASSVATLADNYTTGFESILSAISTLSSSDKLKGTAYTNVKEYGDTVVAPLAKGMILLAEAAKTDTQMLPDRYRSDVGEDELSDDTEVLSAEIEALNSTINTNNSLLEGMKSGDPNRSTAENAVKSDTAERDKRQKKLNKINAYDAASSGFFSDIAGLEADISSGLTLLNQGIAGFNGTFTIPSKKDLAWADNINKNYEIYTNYQSAIAKVKKGEELTEEEAKAIEAYQKQHPSLTLDKSVEEAKEAKLTEADVSQSAEDLAKKAGISYEQALDWLLYGKEPADVSKKAVDFYNSIVTYKGEMAFINGRKIVVDAKGRVRMGSKQINLYNRETGRVYKNRTAKTFEQTTGEKDIRKTNVGRGVKTTGWQSAWDDAKNFGKQAAKDSLKNSLNPLNEFKDFKSASKWAKGGKVLGAAGTVINIGGNIKENFFDDKKSSIGEKIGSLSTVVGDL